MLSAVLQPEIDTLQSQIAQLQAQITAAQERVKELGECEMQTDGAIQALQTALQKVSALAPGALAALRQTVLNLFNGGGDASDDGNQPTPPAPQPDLNGQSTEPCCYSEDCPSESLLGQSVEVECLIDHPQEPSANNEVGEGSEVVEKNLFNLIPVSATVAYMRKNDGEIASTYAGFNNKTKAKLWGEWLAVHHSVASGFEVRESKRLTDFKYEVKLWSMSLKQIERLAGCDLMKSPPSNYGDAPKRKPERVPSMLEIESIGVGDTVQSITVKHWQYKVTKINSDGFYECDRIGTNPTITQVLHPGSVELIRKADVVDAVSSELSEYLEQQEQSALIAVFKWVIYNSSNEQTNCGYL